MDDRGGPRDPSEDVATDLVEYLIVAVPDLGSLAMVAPALAELVQRAAIRILDLVAVAKAHDGSLAAMELDAVDALQPLRNLLGDTGRMLSDHDIELASLALRPGSAAVILVTEDRWAEPLSAAARRVGGRIVAGERIPASRVESALAVRSRSDSPSDPRGA